MTHTQRSKSGPSCCNPAADINAARNGPTDIDEDQTPASQRYEGQILQKWDCSMDGAISFNFLLFGNVQKLRNIVGVVSKSVTIAKSGMLCH